MQFHLLFLLSAVTASTIHDVKVTNAFFPNKVDAVVGDTVRFRFSKKGTHTVIQEGPTPCQPPAQPEFDFKVAPGMTAEKTFTKPGVYNYFSATGQDCQRGMRGVITVVAQGAAPPVTPVTPVTGNSTVPAGAGGSTPAVLTAPPPKQDPPRPSADPTKGPVGVNTTAVAKPNEGSRTHAALFTVLSVAVVAWNL
jgi:plastocyanin